MMLPPIRKPSTTPLGTAAYTSSPGGVNGARRNGDFGAAVATDKSLRDEPQHSPPASSFVLDRIHTLERENELMRAELAHLRQHLSNNQQQREDERFSLTKVSDELQRLVHAFNSKLQADGVFQQREQQKCALLFAEVARLGHSVESVELSVKTVGDDARRRFELHEQQLQLASKQQQQHPSPPSSSQRGGETQQQVAELQHAVALLKSTLTQLRSEVEAERGERWRGDAERNLWLADLRAAVAKVDASVDSKLIFHVERLNNRLATDRMDVMRLLEEHRELTTGADFKRISSQMLEFSRLSDHLQALERWIHTEFGHIKRVFQFVASDTDGRLQTLAVELVASLERQRAMLFQQEDEQTARLRDLHDAVREVAHSVQRKLLALEDVVPLEVKARQQHDDKLRRRVESVVKALTRAIEATREECVVPQAQLRTRLQIVEDAQREIVDQVDDKHAVVTDTIRAFLRDSDAMLARLAASVELERQRPLAPCATTLLVHEPASAADPALPLASSTPPTVEEWMTYFESQVPLRLAALRGSVLDDVERKLGELATRELVEQQAVAVESLRAWIASHAHECGQCYEYLNWAVESMKTDDGVRQCLAAVVDQVADVAALEEFETLEDNTGWAVQQLAMIQAQQQLQGGNCQSLDARISSSDSALTAAALDRDEWKREPSARDADEVVAAAGSRRPDTADGGDLLSSPSTATAADDAELEDRDAGAGAELWL